MTAYQQLELVKHFCSGVIYSQEILAKMMDHQLVTIQNNCYQLTEFAIKLLEYPTQG